MDLATETFAVHRNLLFTVAYEMLGSAAAAEDILQETWLRWAGVDLAEVRDQRAYLVRITTRQALSRLRTLRRRRESYVGPWLPEPLLTAPSVAEDVELAESVSMAMLLVLETLTPTERARARRRSAEDVRSHGHGDRRRVDNDARLPRGGHWSSEFALRSRGSAAIPGPPKGVARAPACPGSRSISCSRTLFVPRPWPCSTACRRQRQRSCNRAPDRIRENGCWGSRPSTSRY
jgi:hypothetical protein